MVTLKTAENALKTVYLGVVSDQLNISANPLLTKIQQTTKDVWGKEIRKLAPFGINGGIGAGTEDGPLPTAGGNNYVQYTSTLKNLYGTIELSDKAIRASSNNAGSFVNLLNAEMEGLIKASTFNFGRMLYGNGKGILASVIKSTIKPHEDGITVDSVKHLMEGMTVSFYSKQLDAIIEDGRGKKRIASIDRVNNKIFILPALTEPVVTDMQLVVQNSLNNELTGLEAIFEDTTTLYGVDRATNHWMTPYQKDTVGEIDDIVIQEAIDYLDEVAGSTVDFITCSSKVRRAYQSYLNGFKRNVDIMELTGGYKAISYNGIPLVSDRFVADDTMYLLNTKEFALHQLCDWQWLEGDDGRVIRQIPGYPTYSATLVKYADLICDKPSGQAKLTGIIQ